MINIDFYIICVLLLVGEHSKITLNTKNVFIESTATDLHKVISCIQEWMCSCLLPVVMFIAMINYCKLFKVFEKCTVYVYTIVVLKRSLASVCLFSKTTEPLFSVEIIRINTQCTLYIACILSQCNTSALMVVCHLQ